jgi:hypothetical protein
MAEKDQKKKPGRKKKLQTDMPEKAGDSPQPAERGMELRGQGPVDVNSSLESKADKLPLAVSAGDKTVPSLGSEFSTKEDKLLYYYYNEGLTKVESALKAGYCGKNSNLQITANRVIKGYVDSGASRDVFRRVGLDERYLAKKLLQIIDNEKAPYSSRIAAIHIATKCLGLQRDVVEGQSGAMIQINFASDVGKAGKPVAITGDGGEVINVKPIRIDR